MDACAKAPFSFSFGPRSLTLVSGSRSLTNSGSYSWFLLNSLTSNPTGKRDALGTSSLPVLGEDIFKSLFIQRIMADSMTKEL